MPPWLIGSLIYGGVQLVSSFIQGNAAKDAAETQSEAADAGIAEQRRQFDAMQGILNPYVQAGNQSLTAQQDMAGLNGPDAQRKAIEAISSSPEMMAMSRQGEESIMQGASATGGLRGGNVQGALAQFRPQLLSSLINQQYGRLSGITQLGQASAAGVGAAGMQSASSISDLLAQQGAATAGGQIAQGQGYANVLNSALTGGMIGYGMGPSKAPIDPSSGYGAYSQVPGVF